MCVGDHIWFLRCSLASTRSSCHVGTVLCCPGKVTEAQSSLLGRCSPPLGRVMSTQAAQIHLFQCVPELIPSLKVHRQGCSVGFAPMITARPEKVGKKPLAGRSHPFLPGLTQAGGTATQPHSSKLSFKMLKKETPFLPPSLLFLLSPSLVLLTRAEAVGYICTSTPPSLHTTAAEHPSGQHSVRDTGH